MCFLRITPTSDPVIQYGLLPGTSAVFDCSEPGHFSHPLEIQWRTFIDSVQDRSALTAVTSVNRSLPLNVSSAGSYLCMATKRFADCGGATTTSMLTLQVNDLIIRKFEIGLAMVMMVLGSFFVKMPGPDALSNLPGSRSKCSTQEFWVHDIACVWRYSVDDNLIAPLR